MLLDNLSGHEIAYKPTKIQQEFLEPNMASFVQLLDAGIIRCFKAHYHHTFCQWAIEMDYAGEVNIYKLDFLKGMLMAKASWDAVSSEMIQNCWNNTSIQG